MTRANLPAEIAEQLAELAIDTDLPRDVVDRFVAEHSAYRDEILRYAIDWHATLEEGSDGEHVAPLADIKLPAAGGDPVVDPFSGKSPAELKKVASECDVPVLILAKIEQRMIRPQSIPLLLIRNLAAALGTKVSALLSFLDLGATLSAGASYRSDKTPEVADKIDFATAIRQTKMDEAQRLRWLLLSE